MKIKPHAKFAKGAKEAVIGVNSLPGTNPSLGGRVFATSRLNPFASLADFA